MSAVELLAMLSERDVRFRAESGRLFLDGPRRVFTPELVQEIKQQHDNLLAQLRADPDRCLHCIQKLEPHRIVTCDACLLHQAEQRRHIRSEAKR